MDSMRCQICSGSETRLIQNTHVHTGGEEIKLVECTQCGLVFLKPQPGENEIRKLYSDDYFIKWYSSPEKRDFSKNYFRQTFRENKLITNGRGNLLDIGCGMGFFLEVAKGWGWNVKGVEVSPYASSYCREELKLDVHGGLLETAGYAHDYFDVITAFDVLEHLPDLSGVLRSVKNVLRNDGMFIVMVPNYDSLVFHLDRIICKLKKAPLPNTPEHLTYFTMESLKKMLHKYDFTAEVIMTTKANDEGDYLLPQGNPMAVLRGILNLACYQAGKLSNRRETILAVASKNDGANR